MQNMNSKLEKDDAVKKKQKAQYNDVMSVQIRHQLLRTFSFITKVL